MTIGHLLNLSLKFQDKNSKEVATITRQRHFKKSLYFPRDLHINFYRTTAPHVLAECKKWSDHRTAFVFRPRNWSEPKTEDFACVCLTCGKIEYLDEPREESKEQSGQRNVQVEKNYRVPKPPKKRIRSQDSKSQPKNPMFGDNIMKCSRADRNQQDVGNWLTRYGVNDREFAEDLLENVINDPRTYYENLLSNQLNSDLTFQEFVVALKEINLSDYYKR